MGCQLRPGPQGGGGLEGSRGVPVGCCPSGWVTQGAPGPCVPWLLAPGCSRAHPLRLCSLPCPTSPRQAGAFSVGGPFMSTDAFPKMKNNSFISPDLFPIGQSSVCTFVWPSAAHHRMSPVAPAPGGRGSLEGPGAGQGPLWAGWGVVMAGPAWELGGVAWADVGLRWEEQHEQRCGRGWEAGLTRAALACPRSGCTAWTCGAPTRPRARRSSASP